jgi:hypothetical protein
MILRIDGPILSLHILSPPLFELYPFLYLFQCNTNGALKGLASTTQFEGRPLPFFLITEEVLLAVYENGQ